MAVQLPNGVTLFLATTYGSPKTVSALSNAASYAQADSTAHGFTNGDFVAVTSGWSRLNDRVVRVSDVATDHFDMEGIDSSDTDVYPSGSGTGTVKKITAWQQILQILDLTTSGGDLAFTTYSFLENDYESQIPTQASPMTMQMTIADDPALASYTALAAAAEARAIRALKAVMPDGSIILYNGYVGFNTTPTMAKNQVMGLRATFNLLSRPVRYAS